MNNAIRRITIAVACEELAAETEFDDITIDMICERAGISRSTFYRTFEDKYQMLLWVQNFPFDHGISKMGRSLTCQQALQASFEGFAIFRNMFHSARNSSERKRRENEGVEAAYQVLRQTIQDTHDIAIDKELEMQLRWTAHSILLTAKEWTTGTHDETPVEVAQLTASCIPSRLKTILDAPPEPEPYRPLDLSLILISARSDAN